MLAWIDRAVGQAANTFTSSTSATLSRHLPPSSALLRPPPRPNVFICNTLIRAFSLSHNTHVPFSVYAYIRGNFIHPNTFTFPFLLKSLANSGEFREGVCVHTHIVKIGHLEDIFVRNSLFNLYTSGGGDVTLCRRMFDELPQRDIVSWTVLITAFEKMLSSKLNPNRVTMVNALGTCSGVREVASLRRKREEEP